MTASKHTLVVYYSLSGKTERVAKDIASRLDADIERIEDKKRRTGFFGYVSAALDSLRERPAQIADISRRPNEYALTLVGTPVWSGRMTPAVRAWLRMFHGMLNEVAFFTTSGATDAEKVVPHMESLAGCKAVAFSGFNDRELKASDLYDRKMSAFVKALRSARSAQVSPA